MNNRKSLFPLIIFAIGCIALTVGIFVDPTVYKALITSEKTFSSFGYSVGQFSLYATYSLRSLGAAAAISGFLGFVLNKRLKDICTFKTSVVALSISATAAVGLVCVLIFLSCSLGGYSKSPVQTPMSLALGIVAFTTFILLLIYYLRTRQKITSFKCALFDVLTALLFVPGFFCLATAVYYYMFCMFSGRVY